MKTDLGNNWERHFIGSAVPTEAYVTCHGSWQNSNGWTTSPSSMIFYTMHGDSLYTAEIDQILRQPSRLRIGSDVFDVSPRWATSISGPNTLVWNYHMTCWGTGDHAQIVEWWRTGPLTGDLLTLAPSDPGTFSSIWDSRATSMLDGLFTTLAGRAIQYEKIHFLVCRAVRGQDSRNATSTKTLYQQRTPYWG